MALLEELKIFRDKIYTTFGARSDANMNTLDALSSYGHQCRRVVELSEAPCFLRQYSSITDGIADGLVPFNFRLKKMASTLYELENTAADNTTNNHVLLVVDCTPNPRPSARKLEDRHITYAPNPAPGNKPICVGHEYSTVAMVPNDALSREKHWLIPLSTERVPSDQKGHEFGMDQIKTCLDAMDLQEKLVVSIADSKYGTEACRKKVSNEPNWAHLFRLNSTRNVYSLAEEPTINEGKVHNKKRYGIKMTLNKASTHTIPNENITTTMINGRGKQYSVTIKVWYNQCVRGSRQFKAYQHPMTLYQITVIDDQGKALYKKPMWLALSGQRRHELSAKEVFNGYRLRYDIEHFFRFGKDKLLIDAYQTPDSQHEEAWWNLASASYAQLYFTRDAVPLLPKKWERYLPSYKASDDREKTIATPSQTQRGFYTVLEQVGTPAKLCIPRGSPKGRALGETQKKRETHPVIFKSTNIKSNTNKSVSEVENGGKNSDSQKVERLAKSVLTQLNNMGVDLESFHQLLSKAT